MAIRDLLWACPECAAFASIRSAERGVEICASCGVRFRRAHGASIEVQWPDGSTGIRTAAELEDRLPPISDMPLPAGRLGPAQALVRIARTTRPVHDRGDFLGRAEIFGPRQPATVTLDERCLAAGIPESPLVWPLDAITAVQPSSSTIQINSRIHPLASFRFVDQSVRLWEQAIQDRIRTAWIEAGRGRIVQFHPHIRSR